MTSDLFEMEHGDVGERYWLNVYPTVGAREAREGVLMRVLFIDFMDERRRRIVIPATGDVYVGVDQPFEAGGLGDGEQRWQCFLDAMGAAKAFAAERLGITIESDQTAVQQTWRGETRPYIELQSHLTQEV